jgi:putative resolvase
MESFISLEFLEVFMVEQKSYSIGEFAEKAGLDVSTVKKYCRNNQLKYTRTPGGDRRIPHEELEKLINPDYQEHNDKAVIYARVSSHDQKDDLETQVKELEEHAERNNLKVTKVYKDIGSGLNEERRQLNKLLEELPNLEADKILVTYEDRLTRFGLNYLKHLFKAHDKKLIIKNEKEEDQSPEQELVEDMIKLVSSFSGKLYGMRSEKKQKMQW